MNMSKGIMVLTYQDIQDHPGMICFFSCIENLIATSGRGFAPALEGVQARRRHFIL